MYRGTGASAGIAMGKAFVLPSWEWDFPDESIDVADLALEFERLYKGIHTSKNELELIKKEVSEFIGHQESSIFDAHMAILDDPVFMNEVQGIIQRQYKVAEVAVKEVIDKFVTMFDLLEDDYMRERAADIKDVGNRLLKHLLGTPDIVLPADTQPFILVTKEITPSQFAHLNPTHVLGVITMLGGRNSHAAIMSRAMGIPFVLGLEGKINMPIVTNDFLIMDGDNGIIYVNPNESLTEKYKLEKLEFVQMNEKLQEIVEEPAQTKDGMFLNLAANISSFKELELALNNGASGVGLFRTEFLYMDRSSLPEEEEQFEVYRQVAERLGAKPLIIRTLDIGGDKKLDYLSFPNEDNPFLGYRAIRISLDQTDLFKTQLKAILRSSQYGNVKIMYPMISSLDEVRKANAILEQAKFELLQENRQFNPHLEVGIMIEVPAAAVIADLLAKEVNFFSIGTNDLIQYVLAVDRMNEEIADFYDPYHPAILRLLQMTVDAAKRQGIPVAVCGELAGDIKALPIWLGMGIHDLSMSAHSILQIKEKIMDSDRRQCEQMIFRMMECRTGEEISKILS